ncbi:hypothetical protein VYU27_000694 [Nannochloropsis oceanica]
MSAACTPPRTQGAGLTTDTSEGVPLLGFASTEKTRAASMTTTKGPLIGFSEAHLLQQVHGAGETTMASISRDSTRSSSMDSTASLGHKADAELMVSFLNEIHSTGSAKSNNMNVIVEPTGPVTARPPSPSRLTREKDNTAAWEGNGESLLLCLKTKDTSSPSTSSSSSPYDTPPSTAKDKERKSSWGDQQTMAGVRGQRSSFGPAAFLKANSSRDWARMEEVDEAEGYREKQQQRGIDEMEEDDAKIMVAFRQTASSSSSDSESSGGFGVSSSSSSSSSSSDDDDDDELIMSSDGYQEIHLARQKQQQQQHHRAASSGSWSLFNCLVTEAGNGSRKLARQRERAYGCPWYRVGYYRRCHDKYGQDASVYDSDDSEYEESAREGEVEEGGQGGPYRSDLTSVRAMMLRKDKSADRAVAGVGGVPKYHRDWGKLKRRDVTRQQQRMRREREERGVGGRGAQAAGLSERAGGGDGVGGHGEREGGGYCLGKIAGTGGGWGPSPRRSPSKKEKWGFVGSSSSNGGKATNMSSSSGSLKKSKLPAPKRQSTALTLSFEVQPNGLIRCKRCGKPNFKNHFALRSHLSHCPGTIHMKEQRMKIEAGLLPPETPLCLPVDEEEREQGPSNAAWVPAYNGSGSGSNLGGNVSRSASGSLDYNAPGSSTCSNHQFKMLASSCSSSSASSGTSHGFNAFPRLQASPGQQQRRQELKQQQQQQQQQHRLPPPTSFDKATASNSSPSSSAPEPTTTLPTYEGTPLVPNLVQNGKSLVGRTISYHHHHKSVHDWTDVLVRKYRPRSRCHLIVHADGTSEWAMLTDRNTRLDPGFHPSLSSASSAASCSDEEHEDKGKGETGSSSSSSSSSSSPRLSNPGFHMEEGLTTGASSNSVTTSGGLTCTSTPGAPFSSPGRNAFFSEQENLLLSRRPAKRKAENSNSSSGISQAESSPSSSSSFTFVRNDHRRQQQQQQEEEDEEEEGEEEREGEGIEQPMPKIMRSTSSDSISNSVGAPGPHHYPLPLPPHFYNNHAHQQHQQHQQLNQLPLPLPPPPPSIPPPYTYRPAHTSAESYALHLAQHIPTTSFVCRRCTKGFHNKQALGWHTRKGCNGHPGTAVTNQQQPSSSPLPPPPPPPLAPYPHPHYTHPPPEHYMYAHHPPPPHPQMQSIQHHMAGQQHYQHYY